MLDAAFPGCVLIIDMGGAPVSTFGGLAAHAALQRGVGGLIVDGGCRDIEEIRTAGLWVSSKHVTPTSGKSRVLVEAINVPITVCGVSINPGDYIIGDETGIVAVPLDQVGEALAIAEELAARDLQFSAALEGGETFGIVASRLKHM
jgi:regulator of RNase E activity RraA